MLFLSMLDTPEEEIRFDKIYNDYERRVFGLAYQYTRNFHDAEDITQSVFFKIAENIKSVPKNPFKLKTYIYTTAKNISLNHLKYLSRRPTLEFVKEEAFAPSAIEDNLAKKEASEKITACIKAMPEMYRDIMIMFYVSELKIKDISTALDLSETTVKNRLAKGKKIFREKLKEVGLDE